MDKSLTEKKSTHFSTPSPLPCHFYIPSFFSLSLLSLSHTQILNHKHLYICILPSNVIHLPTIFYQRWLPHAKGVAFFNLIFIYWISLFSLYFYIVFCLFVFCVYFFYLSSLHWYFCYFSFLFFVLSKVSVLQFRLPSATCLFSRQNT